jgi:hypothetical protein
MKLECGVKLQLLLVIAIFVALLLGFPFRLFAEVDKQYQAAKLVEAEEYSACDYQCAPFNHPTTAYCFQLGDLTLIGERGTLLGETDAKSMRDFSGKEIQIRLSQTSIWINRADHGALELKRGSIFEGFNDKACIGEVHKAKLEIASKIGRPSNIPSDAFVLAGPLTGDVKPLFRWFQCTMSADASSINCKKWGRDGSFRGVDRYCARTVAGEPVSANFEIDKLLSRDGKLILKSGYALKRDERPRVNGELTQPGVACYQVNLSN